MLEKRALLRGNPVADSSLVEKIRIAWSIRHFARRMRRMAGRLGINLDGDFKDFIQIAFYSVSLLSLGLAIAGYLAFAREQVYLRMVFAIYAITMTGTLVVVLQKKLGRRPVFDNSGLIIEHDATHVTIFDHKREIVKSLSLRAARRARRYFLKFYWTGKQEGVTIRAEGNGRLHDHSPVINRMSDTYLYEYKFHDVLAKGDSAKIQFTLELPDPEQVSANYQLINYRDVKACEHLDFTLMFADTNAVEGVYLVTRNMEKEPLAEAIIAQTAQQDYRVEISPQRGNIYSIEWEFEEQDSSEKTVQLMEKFFQETGYATRAFSASAFELRNPDNSGTAAALLWDVLAGKETRAIQKETAILCQTRSIEKIYLVYRNKTPSSNVIQEMRKGLRKEIIPLQDRMLEKALSQKNCAQKLREMEEPYLARMDPYAESKPINDPNWFYGRQDFLRQLPPLLMQGQHVGIFGLRKIGKTSLLNQLRQRFADIPTVFIDCQAFSARKEDFFREIIKQLFVELPIHVTNKCRPNGELTNSRFREQIIEWHRLWRDSGHNEPFLLIFDEIDKLFPDRDLPENDPVLKEYVQLFRILRGLAQSTQGITLAFIAYRPDINRHNLLTSSSGENPMFKSIAEKYLGYLSEMDSVNMIREIGMWREIKWDEPAAREVFHYCGGHPLVTRLFASAACAEGKLKHVTMERIRETACHLQKELRRNDIGNYFKEGIWEPLRQDEQELLALIHASTDGLKSEELPEKYDDAITNLQHFGLIKATNEGVRIAGGLFQEYLDRRIG